MSIIASFVPSPEGRAAVAEAAQEARRRGCHLHLLHFVSLDDPAGTPRREGEGAAADSEVQRLGKQLESEGVPTTVHVERRSTGGSFLGDFFRVVHELQPELIVLGIRKRSPVGKALLGSRSQDILLEADCPVLAVKSPEDMGGHDPVITAVESEGRSTVP